MTSITSASFASRPSSTSLYLISESVDVYSTVRNLSRSLRAAFNSSRIVSFRLISSPWRPLERPPPQQMHVNVIYGLARIGSVVHDHPIARIRDAQLACQIPRDDEQTAHRRHVIVSNAI